MCGEGSVPVIVKSGIILKCRLRHNHHSRSGNISAIVANSDLVFSEGNSPLISLGVEIGKITPVQFHGHGFALSGLEIHPAETFEGLHTAIGPVFLGTYIQLHDFSTGSFAGIGYFGGNGDGSSFPLTLCGNVQISDGKGGIG